MIYALSIIAGAIGVLGLWTFLGAVCAHIERDRFLNWTLRDD